MTNDNNKKPSKDEKSTTEKNLASSVCKPCMPIERNGNNKEKSSTTKKPSTSDTSSVASCYAKCSATPSSAVQKDSASGSSSTLKTAAKPSSDQPTRVGSCYAKCGPPSVQQQDSTSTPTALDNAEKSQPSTVGGSCEAKPLSITNPFIEKMDEDILYHIALGNKSHDLPNMFGDVKFVVMGSTPKRMEQFAYFMASQLKYELAPGTILNDISRNSHRYAMFKVGPILSVSHGMGTPSIGILLHELIKLMSHAGIKDPTFVRIGTCGGFNKKAGTVVVSNKVVNDFMEPFYELTILGKKIRFPATLDQTVMNEIISLSGPEDKFETIAGATYCTDNFYEGSGRADGAICEFSETESLNYYKELQRNGVVNVEMESLAFAALTCRAGIKSAIVTVILSDRLETEQIEQTKEFLDECQARPQRLLAKYIKKKLAIDGTSSAGVTSVTKIPTSSSSTTETTTSKSSGGTGSDSGTTLMKPTTTGASSTTSTLCKSCGGSGKTPSFSTSSNAPYSDSSTAKPSSGSATCKSCGGTGKDTQTNPDTAYSTAPGVSVCKSCEGSGKVNDISSITGKSSSSVCDTCQGSGKDVAKPASPFVCGASLVPKSTGSNFESTSSTTKPNEAVCKSCLGSGKMNVSSASIVACESCGGAGVVKAGNDTTVSSSSVCKSCTQVSKEDGSKVTQSTTSVSKTANETVCRPCTAGAGAGASTPVSKASESRTSTLSNACKPRTDSATATGGSGTGSATVPPLVRSSNVCKPCLSTGSSTATSGSTTSAPFQGGYDVCKPCVSGGMTNNSTTTKPSSVSGGTTASKPASAATTSQVNSKEAICKPCVGIGSTSSASSGATSAYKPDSTASIPSSQSYSKGVSSTASGLSTVIKHEKSETGSTPDTTGGSTTSKPRCNFTSTSSTPSPSGFSSGGVCKPCTSSSSTTGATSAYKSESAATTRSSQSYSKGVCKPCGSASSADTHSGLSTVIKREKSETGSTHDTTGGSTTSKSRSDFTSTSSTSSSSGFSSGGVCKPCTSSSSTTGATSTYKSESAATTPSTQSYSKGVCKPCGSASTASTHSGLSTTTSQPSISADVLCKQFRAGTTLDTSTVKPAIDATTTQAGSSETTTSRPSISDDELCKRFRAGTAFGTSTVKPDNNATTTEPTIDSLYKRSSSGTLSKGTPSDSTATTPSSTSTKSVGVCKPCSGVTGSTTSASSITGEKLGSTTSSDDTSSAYKPDPASTTTGQAKTEPATNNGGGITQRQRSKCVPFTCYTADKTDTTPLPTTPKAYLAKDFDSSSTSTISNESSRSCYQKCSSKAPTSANDTLSTSKLQIFKTPDQDNMKGVPHALGPCCASNGARSGPVEFREVPDAKGPCCSASSKSEENSSTGSRVTTQSTPLESHKSFCEVKTEPGSTSATPNTDQVVDSKQGSCCGGRGSETTSRSVSSNSNSLSSCCSGQSAQPQNVTSKRSTVGPQYFGPLSASKILDDSPDEPCGKSVKSEGSSDSTTSCPFVDQQSTGKAVDDIRKGSTESSQEPPGPFVSNVKGCPISIGGPCIYSKENSLSESTTSDQSKQTSTPKPSPDTPDTSTTRSMPTFVTPTPPSSKICGSKFIYSGNVLVTAVGVNKEANKYDESPSPCASCKKYQEDKANRSTGSTSSDSQPEIIKCPHKLKRLKDECQGYD